MPDVSFKINGRQYEVSCNPGEEARLAELADYLNRRVTALAEQLGQIGEMRLLVMGGLLVTDELSDTMEKLRRRDEDVAELKRTLESREKALAEALLKAAERAERVAADLEGT
jgi:cell division protein ZapA